MRFLTLLLSVFLLSSCVMGPAFESSDFLGAYDGLSTAKGLELAYVKPGVRFASYDTIEVSSVDASRVEGARFKEDKKQELLLYIEQAFKDTMGYYFQEVSDADEAAHVSTSDLRLELALTQLEKQRFIAHLEGKLIDTQTGETLFAFGVRQTNPASPRVGNIRLFHQGTQLIVPYNGHFEAMVLVWTDDVSNFMEKHFF